MDERSALRMLRDWMRKERTDLMESYNRPLPERDYLQTVGRVKQLNATESKLNDILKMKGDDE